MAWLLRNIKRCWGEKFTLSYEHEKDYMNWEASVIEYRFLKDKKISLIATMDIDDFIEKVSKAVKKYDWILNTDEDSMEIAGKITASLERTGNMMDIRDGFGVLTNNVGYFNKIKHLKVVSGKANGDD